MCPGLADSRVCAVPRSPGCCCARRGEGRAVGTAHQGLGLKGHGEPCAQAWASHSPGVTPPALEAAAASCVTLSTAIKLIFLHLSL